MTLDIVKMSIPEVKITVLKNLLIFGEKYLPQSVRLLEGGGVLKRYLAECRLNMHYPYQGLPLLSQLSPPKLHLKKATLQILLWGSHRDSSTEISPRYFQLTTGLVRVTAITTLKSKRKHY